MLIPATIFHDASIRVDDVEAGAGGVEDDDVAMVELPAASAHPRSAWVSVGGGNRATN